MAFGAVEIIALVVVIVVLIKFLFFVFSPKSWMAFAKKLYSNGIVLFVAELILAVVVFYFLIQTFTIVQIMAVITLGALLTGMSFALYGKETLSAFSKLFGKLKKDFWKRTWLIWLIWVALSVWTLVALF